MDSAASNHRMVMAHGDAGADGACDTPIAFEPQHSEQARSKRHSLFIQAAKLVGPQGEFVCVVRDVSKTGVGIRLFHSPPPGQLIELKMPDGGEYEIRQMRRDGQHVGYEFASEIDLPKFLHNNPEFPKRGLRLELCFPVRVRTLMGEANAIVENLSQHGARLSCDERYAIDQSLLVDCPEEGVSFGEVRAKVRWRRDDHYGLAFDRTLSLEEFAKLAASLQCPDLLRSGA